MRWPDRSGRPISGAYTQWISIRSADGPVRALETHGLLDASNRRTEMNRLATAQVLLTLLSATVAAQVKSDGWPLGSSMNTGLLRKNSRNYLAPGLETQHARLVDVLREEAAQPD
jgi:hypothetical protein